MSEVPEFPKIDTLLERDPKTFKIEGAKPYVFRRPEFGVPERWLVTEKVDGANVRISLETEHQYDDGVGADRWVVRFYGRTAAARMPTFLLGHLRRTFTLERMMKLWRGKSNCDACHGTATFDAGKPTLNAWWPQGGICPCVEPYPIVLYGEGYGAKIQKGGGNYRRDNNVSFRLFDVLIGETWLRRANVEDVARQLGIDAVPLLTVAEIMGPLFEGPIDWPLDAIVGSVRRGLISRVANEEGMPGVQAEGVVAFTDPPLFNGRGQRLMWKLKTRDF